VLDEGTDPRIVAAWMAQVQREQRELEAGSANQSPARASVLPKSGCWWTRFGRSLRSDPGDKAEPDAQLGVNLTYDPERRVTVQMSPRGVKVRVGGGTRTISPQGSLVGGY
jgi:hypothetical protein